ncbi:MAG: ribose-phosphate diphosphokinase [Bernardetiaceae bacterium]
MLIFSTPAYGYLQTALCREAGFEAGLVVTQTFPDGETYHRLQTPIRRQDCLLIGGTIDEVHTLALFDLACGLVHSGAASLTLCIPYLGYSTMERATRSGEIVKAKNRARLLSAIPKAPLGNRVLFVDLHVSGIEHYLEGDLRSYHLYAKAIIMEEAQALAQGRPFVLASTDAGRAKWVESLANDLGVEAAFVYKKRLSGARTEVSGINADVRQKVVVIYDDMIRTGGSLIQAARAYREAGAAQVYAIATHGILPGDALTRIRSSGAIEHLVTTDTHPRAVALADDFLSVRSIAPLLRQALT